MSFPYDNVKALVMGAGVSGEAAARLLLARGGHVVLIDEAAESRHQQVADGVRAAGGRALFGGGELPDEPFDVCVVSPAFAQGHRWIAACRARGVPLISELELGGCYWQGKILAVTGSKGKSSLVKFCADTLRLSGVSASPAGNYGIPLCRLVLEQPELQWAVAEVSSFQMEHTRLLRPDIAILLNLQADHLDRHADMNEYKGLKIRLFSAMREGSVALLPSGLHDAGGVPAGVRMLRFGVDAGCDWRYVDHRVVGMADGRSGRVNVRGAWFDNEVLGVTAAAGVAALHAVGLSDVQIQQGFLAFEPLPHRVQFVGESASGVRFVDDSKATSLAALAAALRMVTGPVRLIAGGLLKEHDLETIKELLTQRTKKVYLIGNSSGEMFKAWSTSVSCEECVTLECAVAAAVRDAQTGETVLLSPGTASFDQFTSYRERGERFTAQVRAVANL